jgi:hypothetical protein
VDGEPAKPTDIFSKEILFQLRNVDCSDDARIARMRHLSVRSLAPAQHLLAMSPGFDELMVKIKNADTFDDLFQHVTNAVTQCEDEDVRTTIATVVDLSLAFINNDDNDELEDIFIRYMAQCLNTAALLWKHSHTLCTRETYGSMAEFQNIYLLSNGAVAVRELADVAPIQGIH